MGLFMDETNLKAGCPTATGWNRAALIWRWHHLSTEQCRNPV